MSLEITVEAVSFYPLPSSSSLIQLKVWGVLYAPHWSPATERVLVHFDAETMHFFSAMNSTLNDAVFISVSLTAQYTTHLCV